MDRVATPATTPSSSTVANVAHVWVFRDFSDNKYKGIINTKGFVSFSNYKKDIYYLYQSFLKPATPVIHIVGPHYFLRNANPAGQGDVKAYSNAPNLTLTINGQTADTQFNGSYRHPNGTAINNVFYWNNVLRLGRNDLVASDHRGNADTATVYCKAAGQTMPNEDGAKVANVTSNNVPAFFLKTALADQRPFYRDFDGSGDNTFDVVPPELSNAVGWIATTRQSDPAKTSNISFDLTSDAHVYVMVTRQASTPSWLIIGGFSDTGISGQWRDNDIKLVDYQLFKRSFAAGSHVSLGSSSVDFVVVVK